MKKNVFEKLKEIIGGIPGVQAGMQLARGKGLSWNQVEAFCDAVGAAGINLFQKYLKWRGDSDRTFADFVEETINSKKHPTTQKQEFQKEVS